MIRAGLPISNGFHVTTDAYRAFVAENDLQLRILSALDGLESANPEMFETASEVIRACFAAGHLPPDIAAKVGEAYTSLSATDHSNVPAAAVATKVAVAVRSSTRLGQRREYLTRRMAGMDGSLQPAPLLVWTYHL